MSDILDLLVARILASPFGESEFAERILGRSRGAVAGWFSGARRMPETVAKQVRALRRVEVHGDELHVVFAYVAPVRRSAAQRRRLRALVQARRDTRQDAKGKTRKEATRRSRRGEEG